MPGGIRPFVWRDKLNLFKSIGHVKPLSIPKDTQVYSSILKTKESKYFQYMEKLQSQPPRKELKERKFLESA